MWVWDKALIIDVWQAKNEEHGKEFNTVEILNAKYEILELINVADSQTHLDLEERTELKEILLEFKDIFQAHPDKWQDKPVHINLKKGTQSTYSRPSYIPQAHYAKLRKEIDCLVQFKVLNPTTNSEWGSPKFCLPKKDNNIRIVHDFHRVNSQIHH